MTHLVSSQTPRNVEVAAIFCFHSVLNSFGVYMNLFCAACIALVVELTALAFLPAAVALLLLSYRRPRPSSQRINGTVTDFLCLRCPVPDAKVTVANTDTRVSLHGDDFRRTYYVTDLIPAHTVKIEKPGSRRLCRTGNRAGRTQSRERKFGVGQRHDTIEVTASEICSRPMSLGLALPSRKLVQELPQSFPGQAARSTLSFPGPG